MEFGYEFARTQTHGVLVMVLNYSLKVSVELLMSWLCVCDHRGCYKLYGAWLHCLQPTTCSLFHHIIAKLLFLEKTSRTDISTAVALLMTWVEGSDEDEY